jgi:hypothetical protein
MDYLEKRATITSKYYVALLDTMKQQVAPKRRGKLSKGISFLQDNAATHDTAPALHKLADLHFELPKHQAYSLDLAFSDYYLFPRLKKNV